MGRLYSRIYVHFLGVLLVVGIAISLVAVLSARGAFVQELAERMARHAAALAAEDFADGSALARRVRQLHDDLDVDITVRDRAGNVLASAGADPPALEEADLARARAGLLVLHHGSTLVVATAIRESTSGALLGTIEAAGRRRPRWTGLSRPALLVALVLVIVAVATAPLARRISLPLERLTEAARRLGAGDLATRAPQAAPRRHWLGRGPHRSDELQTLTTAFNDMADRVQRLVAAQNELLANVSHELRSPLARIRVALELLPRGGGVDAHLKDVETDLAELERLIEDVLTAARLEATGLPPHPSRVEARQLLVELAERAAHNPGLSGKVVPPAPGPPAELTADPALLRRALWNLVENAAKHGVPPITLAVERQGSFVSLSVTDEGEGIPPEERERVLTPFYRRDKARTPAPEAPSTGFGLGLTLVRRVAEVHGGMLTIGPSTTVAGRERGCRVTLALPAGPIS